LTIPTEGIDDLKLVHGARHTADSDWWVGGQILDPDNSKTYTLRLRIDDDTLPVRGYIDPFYRTQSWVRAQ
jgi:uncharacterized protein (DUF2147 family)